VTVNPLSPVKNTRETYNRQLEKVVTEVQVQFAEENPAWIPLETLLAMQNVKNNG
jgi:hypothetical protein